MNRHVNTEDQAVLNLLYLGDDQFTPDTYSNFSQIEFKVLKEDRHKIKSNTVHLKNIKNTFNNT